MNFPSDASFVTKAILAKEHRATPANACWIPWVMLRYDSKWRSGAGDTKLKRIENDELGKAKRRPILNRARHFKAAIEQYAGELEEFGQTAEATAEFSTTILAFEQAVITVKEANKGTHVKHSRPDSKGNEFYVKLNALHRYGRKSFERTIHKKLADYIIYGRLHRSAFTALPRIFVSPANDLLEWDEIDNAVKLRGSRIVRRRSYLEQRRDHIRPSTHTDDARRQSLQSAGAECEGIWGYSGSWRKEFRLSRSGNGTIIRDGRRLPGRVKEVLPQWKNRPPSPRERR